FLLKGLYPRTFSVRSARTAGAERRSRKDGLILKGRLPFKTDLLLHDGPRKRSPTAGGDGDAMIFCAAVRPSTWAGEPPRACQVTCGAASAGPGTGTRAGGRPVLWQTRRGPDAASSSCRGSGIPPR